MSDLQTKFAEFQNKYHHKPNATQFSKYAQIKYCAAVEFIKTKNGVTQRSTSSLMRNSTPIPKQIKSYNKNIDDNSSNINRWNQLKNQSSSKSMTYFNSNNNQKPNKYTTNNNNNINNPWKHSHSNQKYESSKQQQHEEKQRDNIQPLYPNSRIEFIGMDDDVINMIDNHTLNEHNKLLILISSLSTNNHQYAAQKRIKNLFTSKHIQFEILDGAQSENEMNRNKLFAISNIRGKYPQIFIISNIKQKEKESMLTCNVNDIKTPLIPQKPQKDCRAYFTGLHVGDVFIDGHISIAYTVDRYSEIVGAGAYKKNSEAFPNAVNTSFDGIAIDSNTRVIIYEKPNFEGNILLDQVGPALINNCLYKDQTTYKVNSMQIMNKTFMDVELQSTFPPDRRYWSKSNMNSWSTGSVKVVGAKSSI
eukprot:213338_1